MVLQKQKANDSSQQVAARAVGRWKKMKVGSGRTRAEVTMHYGWSVGRV